MNANKINSDFEFCVLLYAAPRCPWSRSAHGRNVRELHTCSSPFQPSWVSVCGCGCVWVCVCVCVCVCDICPTADAERSSSDDTLSAVCQRHMRTAVTRHSYRFPSSLHPPPLGVVYPGIPCLGLSLLILPPSVFVCLCHLWPIFAFLTFLLWLFRSPPSSVLSFHFLKPGQGNTE